MVFYRFPRQQEVITSPDIPETIGIATEQAFNFARAARACITLDSTNLMMAHAERGHHFRASFYRARIVVAYKAHERAFGPIVKR